MFFIMSDIFLSDFEVFLIVISKLYDSSVYMVVVSVCIFLHVPSIFLYKYNGRLYMYLIVSLSSYPKIPTILNVSPLLIVILLFCV